MKRVYARQRKATSRALVDRLRPRGVSKEKARVDLWMKAVAPSNALRASVPRHFGRMGRVPGATRAAR